MTPVSPRATRIKFPVLTLFFFLSSLTLFAQNKISGVVRDKETNETLIGAAVVIKGTTNGVVTDVDGKWELSTTNEFPLVILVSYLGYTPLEFTATKSGESFALRMQIEGKTISEVRVVSDRVAQKIKESPVTIERMGIQEIKQTASVGFYEGLSSLKGVDMTSASLGFKIINTRGFNSTSPVRTLQIIDGVDNQAPGLNFSLGNFVGASEIDVERVDIVVGANSATYGPNAFNGVIDIQTKDPYKYEGVNIMVKGAERNFFEGAIRVAHVSKEMELNKYSDGLYNTFARFNNKVLKDRFAYKLNASYLRADDWQAVNYGKSSTSFNDVNNGPGYDAVNIYGESEYPTFTKRYTAFELTQQPVTPETDLGKYYKFETLEGEQVPFLSVYRTGYKEAELTNYNTSSLKLQGGAYYKLPKNIGTLSYNYNYGTGSTVYQGDNRYAIKDIQFIQQKLELKNDKYFVRAYQTTEDAGNSYDLVFTAFKMLQASKTHAQWYRNFEDGFRDAYNTQGLTMDQSIEYAHKFADTSSSTLLKYRGMLQPGTPEFQSEFNRITSNPSYSGGGTKFSDQSYMRHIQGQYDFDLSKIYKYLPSTFKVGGNYRYFNPNSNGTIFVDTLIDRNNLDGGFVDIHTYEYGVYANTEKYVYKEAVKLIGSLRYDDHQNFNPFYTPALSTVITVKQVHNIRLTYTTASRNPTLQDQYLLYDIGVAKLRGNLNGFDMILPQDYFGQNGYIASRENFRPIHVNGVQPERVQTGEIGYKGILLRNIYVDASYYYSEYRKFLGYIVGFIAPDGTADGGVEVRPTRVAANANSTVITQGLSLGATYYFPKYFNISSNYTFSELLKRDANDPLIPFFNTPKHKANVSFGGRDIRNFGFNVNYKYVDGFDYFGSPQFTGPVRSYALVDVQLNYTFPKYGTTFKAGASNILNNLHFEAYGAPLIGRLAYFSVNYQFNK
ncbi:MAG: carboxypeptidase-like regulatory domain-containing protein [Bacteroidota bacterium]